MRLSAVALSRSMVVEKQCTRSAAALFHLRGLSSSSSSGVVSGTVKWFDSKKGFGFIIPHTDSGVNQDVFVHQSNIVADGFRSLADGEQVEFGVQEDNRGRKLAVNVTGPGGSSVQGSQPARSSDFGRSSYSDDNDDNFTGEYVMEDHDSTKRF